MRIGRAMNELPSVLPVLALCLAACGGDRGAAGSGKAKCRTETWCASVPAASRVARDEARNPIGCPAFVVPLPTGAAGPEGQGGDSLANHPVYHRLRSLNSVGEAPVDEAATQKSYAAGDVDACCYSWAPPC